MKFTILWTSLLVIKVYVRALDSPFFISPSVGSFSSQDAYCKENHGRLVTIDTKGKYDRIMELDGQYHGNAILSDKLFIGLTSMETDCTNYKWSSGQTMTWSKWDVSEQEPDECMVEQCVGLIFGFFKTIVCNLELKALCELGYFLPNSNLFINPSPSYWIDSVKYCSMIGGRLIVLEDEKKMQTTMQELQNSNQNWDAHRFFWIGLASFKETCEYFVWVNGETMEWNNLKTPIDCTKGRCVAWSVYLDNWFIDLCNTNKRAVCEYGYEEKERYFCSKRDVTWSEAKYACAHDHGMLATLQTPDRYIYAFAYHGNSIWNGVWIGLSTQSISCTTLAWTNGSPLTWANWKEGHPEQCGTEYCVGLTFGGFRTIPCTSRLKALCVHETSESLTTTITKTTGKMLLSMTQSSSPTSAKTTVMSTLSVRMSTMLISLLSSSTTKTSVIPTAVGEASKTATSAEEASTMATPAEEASVMVTAAEEMPMAPQLPPSPQMTSTKMTATNTDTATTVTTPVPTSDTTSTNIPCTWRQTNKTHLSQAELLDVIAQLKAQLAVSKNKTSTFRRKRISVYESKPSSMAIGFVACTIMSVVISWLVVPDFITMCMFLFKLGYKFIVTP